MMNFAQFHFLRPEWFWLVPVLIVISVLWWRRAMSRGNWADVCDGRLLPYILEQQPERSSRYPWALFLIASLLAITALAGPTWKRLPTPVYRNESALVIVLDLSKSMDAEDLRPSRLIRARYKISDLLKQRKDGLTALVVYSTEPYTVAPLTDDSATISSQLAALETSIMPAQGSLTSKALQHAVGLLRQSGNLNGNILLVSDSVDSEALSVAKALHREGYRLFVLGVGSEEGAPIPVEGGGFLKDASGNIVISKLESKKLESLARIGSGFYENLSLDDRDINLLVRSFDQSKELPQSDSTEKYADQWVEEGPWLLLVVLPMAAFAFRRGYLAILVFLILPFPESANAWQWADLWQTRDQRAYTAYQNGDFSEAAELFEDPDWKAASEYASGQYQNALESLKNPESETSDTAYNKGNALARSGRFQDALEAYDQALQLDSDDEDARYNRDLIEKLMDQQDSSKNQSPDQDNSSEDQNSTDEQNSSQDQNSSEEQKSGKQSPENADSNDSETEQNDQRENDSPTPENSENARQSETSESEETQNQGEENRQSDSEQAESERNKRDSAGEPIDESSDTPSEQARQQANSEQLQAQELQQANEQWLRRIPDDPGGLLRRKFKYQYKKSNPHGTSGANPW